MIIAGYPIDPETGEVLAPYRVATLRYQHRNEVIEFKIEWYSGDEGKRRVYVSRTVVKRITPVVASCKGTAKSDALSSRERARLSRLQALSGSRR